MKLLITSSTRCWLSTCIWALDEELMISRVKPHYFQKDTDLVKKNSFWREQYKLERPFFEFFFPPLRFEGGEERSERKALTGRDRWFHWEVVSKVEDWFQETAFQQHGSPFLGVKMSSCTRCWSWKGLEICGSHCCSFCRAIPRSRPMKSPENAPTPWS